MAVLSFLFWNLNRSDLRHRVALLAQHFDVDILVLAECVVSVAEIIRSLEQVCQRPYCLPFSEASKLRIFTRLPDRMVVDAYNDENGRITIRRLLLPGSPELLLAAVHFPSRANWDVEDLTLYATRVAFEIQHTERASQHSRSLVVGDFNLNPFDTGLAGAGGLHGVMTRPLASRISREVAGKVEPMFYNPMWGCFGDRTPGPAGSFYLRSSKPLNYYWNVYDQVLLRPALADALTDLHLLDHDGQSSLLTAGGLPDASLGSDHLPLFFRLTV